MTLGNSPSPYSPSGPLHPKGVKPSLLLEQIFNTASFLPDLGLPARSEFGYASRILETQRRLTHFPDLAFGHAEYFELLVAAHFTTACTLVPTDVDNSIREKLWLTCPTQFELKGMIDFLFEVASWDMRPVSTRWVSSSEGEILAGHNGEYLALMVAAYACSQRRIPGEAPRLYERMTSQIDKEIAIYDSLIRERKPLDALRACALIAHNLGDFSRVIEAFHLPSEDPLRIYQDSLYTTHPKKEIFQRCAVLYRDHLAAENHRNLPLRAARSLRKSVDLIVPLGPFLDDWGRTVGRHPLLTHEDVSDICYHLIEGWERLGTAVGYARALHGIEETFPGGRESLCAGLPSRAAKKWRTGPLRVLCDIPQSRFEAQWSRLVERG